MEYSLPKSLASISQLCVCNLIEVDADEPSSIVFVGSDELDVSKQIITWCSESMEDCLDSCKMKDLNNCITPGDLVEWFSMHHARFYPEFNLFI